MRGQIEKRGADTWRLRWYEGRGASGRRIYGSHTLKGTKRDAERELRERIRKHERAPAGRSRETVDAFLDRWLKEAASHGRRIRTVRDYAYQLGRYVRPLIGAKRLSDLTVLDVQAMANALRDRTEPRPLGASTVRHAHAALSAALQDAVAWGMIPANPCRGVRLPKNTTKRARLRALTMDEAGKLRAAVQGRRLEALVVLLLGTGLRPSEALALAWSHVDLEAGELQVERTLPRLLKDEPIRFEDPKTAAGRRRVKLGPIVVAALRAHKARQAAGRLRVGRDYRTDLDLVFANRIGEPLDETMVATRTFKPAAKRAGVPDATLYDLRHTHATHALGATGDPLSVAARLGHASPKMTLDVYGHALPDRVAAVADAVEGALFGR